MNTEGCPSGMFTDEIMLLPGRADPCTSPTLGWIVIAFTFSIARLLLVVPIYLERAQHWRAQEQRLQKSPTSNNKNKRDGKVRPHRWMIHAVVGILQILFVILATLNIVNTRNGASPFLVGVFFVPTGIEHALQATKIVRLGRKIVPLSQSKFPQLKRQDLERADFALRIWAFLTASALFIMFLFFFLGLVIPGGSGGNPWTLHGGLGFTGVYQLFITCSVAWQFHRCISAVLILRQDIIEAEKQQVLAVTAIDGTGDKHKSALNMALGALRMQQNIVLFVGIFSLTLSLLFATEVIPLTWYVALIAFFIADVALQSALLLSSRSSRIRQQKHATSTATSNQNTNGSGGVDGPAAVAGVPPAQLLPQVVVKEDDVISESKLVAASHADDDIERGTVMHDDLMDARKSHDSDVKQGSAMQDNLGDKRPSSHEG